jgi:electron transfer flavoprotein alpha subunit
VSEVWVVAEQRLGRLMSVSLELLGKGTELAQKLSVKSGVILLGDDVRAQADELAYHGVDRVYLGEDPRLRLYQSQVYAELIAELIRAHGPQIVLIGATSIGRDLAARIAAKLKAGLVAHCVELDIIDEGGEMPYLVQVVPGWGGNLMVNIACPVKRPQIATVSPGILTKCERKEGKGEIVRMAVDIRKESRVETLEMIEGESSEVALEEAEVVVAGGWGLFSAGGLQPVEELAQVLGGTIAGTRPAMDSGWVPEQRMIGQSGKTVSPKLFISVGASGAPQFTTGFVKAKVVLAIDRNPDAAIFDVADIGLVGDLYDIIPCLVSELKETGLCV